ncbi:hypothetical protein [Nonomuraea sp. NPDC005692]|uniref:hypothetical protein n=1 Tax=Nonomuraea sp. NPDC005692 TaxID=3157168 RepID=UPI0033DFD613
MVRSGAAWLSTIRIAGRPAIRLCVTSHRTGLADTEAVAGALAEARKRAPIA